VVAPDEMHAVRVSQLEADKKGYCFNTEEAAVDVITCERNEIVSERLRRRVSRAEEGRPLAYQGTGNLYPDKALQS